MNYIIAIIKPHKLDPAIIEAIQSAAETGAIGDGKIFKLELTSALRIRTGDTGETAL